MNLHTFNNESDRQPAITGYARYKDVCGNPERQDAPELTMRLQAADGTSFSLYVDGYEFPDEELGPCEDNPADEFDTGRFLIVTCSFTNAEGSWRATGPIMETTELERLARWFESIARGKPTRRGVYFTERELELMMDEQRTTLSVAVFWDFLPPWVTQPDYVTLDFPLVDINPADAAAAIRSQLTAFPGRPPIKPTA